MLPTSIWKKLFFLVVFLIVFGSLIVSSPGKAKATLESCTASVTPNSMTTSVSQNFTFTLTNTGSNPVLFFKVTSPSAAFTIQGKDASGWSATHNSSFVQFWGGSIAASDSLNFTVLIQAGTEELASTNWTVVANDALSDTGTTTCSGGTGIAITGVADVIGPALSELITISNITTSAATINWTTDETSNSVVNYGSTDSLGSTKTSATLTVSHIVTLDSLSAGTTYYFEVASSDESGNTTTSSQGSFTTAAAGTTTSTTSTTTNTTTTTTVTPTPTPTPVVDRTPPRVIIETEFNEPFEASPIIEGRATDNKDIASIEYSTDGGNNWLPVDEAEDLGKTKTNFDFIPFLNEDGNYPIQVRAKDKQGNTGTSKEVVLVIDRLPPLIGGNLISLGPQPLMPNADGTVIALAGLEQKITLSAVGGPIAIDLFVGEKKIPLEYSPETSLWSGFLDLDEVGTYTLTAKAVDGAKNKTTRDLNQIQVVGAGKIINKETSQVATKGRIAVFVQDTQTKLWNLWDAKAFSQENPQSLDETGTYQFFLPPGTYYLQVESAGFSTLKTQIFSLTKSQPINTDFILEEGRAIKLGPFRINLPVFLQKTLDIDLALSKFESSGTSSSASKSSLIGQIAPPFSLTTNENQFQSSSLRGETSIISFVSTWSPPAIEQISIINQLVEEELAPVVMVATQETASKIAIFRQRGNYQTPIWVDPDGELIEKYQLATLPTHFVLDRRGKIIQILTQVLNRDQVLGLLSSSD